MTSLEAIGVQRWDALAAAAGYYSSSSWLLAYEQDRAASVRYLLVEDDQGTLLGALPIYRVIRESNDRYDPVKLALTETGKPTLILGSRRGYRSAVLIPAGISPARRSAVADSIRLALSQLSSAEECELYWAYVPDDGLADVMACGGSPAAREVAAEATITVPPGGFEEYAAGLRTQRRHKVRRERRRFLQVGYQVGIEALPPLVPEAAPLLAQLEGKYGSPHDATYYGYYLKRLAEARDPGQVMTCRYDGQLVGFCLFYTFAGTLWARVAGFDYPRLHDGFEYFNLGFYELIEHGATVGAHTVHLGMGSLDAKLNHGATAHRLWATRFDSREGLDAPA